MKYTKTLLFLCLCAMVVFMVSPAQSKMKDMNFPELGKIEVPQPDKVVLDNGMTIYLLEDHTLPRFNVTVSLNKCGSYLEPPGKLGLADMTGEVMRTGGTTSMTGDEIDAELEAIGAYVETGIDVVSGFAGAGGLSEYKDKIIGILADVLRNPVFADDKIDLARSNQKSTISRRNDDPMGVTIREYRKVIYGDDSPYARYPEYATIDAVKKNDIVMFHQLLVQPNNIQIGVVGDFNKDEMIALLKEKFGDWPAGTMDIPNPPDVEYEFKPGVHYAEKTDVTQSNVLVGHIGGKMGDPDYPATIVMNSVLGGSFGSRITDNVRTKKGYAYAAQASYTFNYDRPGFFYAYAGTKLESTIDAIRVIKEQIESMQTVPPTEDEMKKAKDGWLNSYVFNFDTKNEVLGRMMTYDYYGMPSDYLQQLKEQVEKVTPQDVVDVAKRKLNPDNMHILVTGDASRFDGPLSEFGEVEEIDITIPSPEVEEFEATDEELAEGMVWLGKMVAALGGVDNFKKIKTLEQKGKLTLTMPQGSMTVEVSEINVMPNKVATIIKTPMDTQYDVYNGVDGWAKSMGQTMLKSADDLEEQKKDMSRDYYTICAGADKPTYKVAFRGDDTFNDNPVVRLDFLTELGAQFTMFVNPESSLPVGQKYTGSTPMGPGEIVTTFNEFKPYSGVKVPVKQRRDVGPMVLETELTAVTINGKIDESIFVKPEGI
ncbi:MAG: pitrilysin family protein [Candidatus Zixiibacteriota bacterium]